MRVVAALGLLVAGSVTGVATVAVHDLWWGLLLSQSALLAAVAALPAGWWSRLAFVVGYDVMVGWLSVPRGEGDYLLSQDLPGYAVLAIGVAVLVGALATLPRHLR